MWVASYGARGFNEEPGAVKAAEHGAVELLGVFRSLSSYCMRIFPLSGGMSYKRG